MKKFFSFKKLEKLLIIFGMTLSSACGSDGAVRLDLGVGPGPKTDAGSGSQTCAAANCADGCCTTAGQCMRPGTQTACGIGGAPCIQCATDQTCRSGFCQNTGPSSYDVVLSSAQVSGCGAFDSCHPYADVRLGSSSALSPTLSGASPSWNHRLFSATRDELLSGSGIHVAVYDDDFNGDDLLGECDIPIKKSQLDNDQVVQDCGENVQAVTITFRALSN